MSGRGFGVFAGQYIKRLRSRGTDMMLAQHKLYIHLSTPCPLSLMLEKSNTLPIFAPEALSGSC